MALLRVNTSFFPRHFEVQTRCLMTIPWDQSGNGVALANELSEISGLEEYTFLRLTSCLFSQGRIRLMPFGSPGCSFACDWAAPETACIGFHSAVSAAVGEYFDPRGSSVEIQYTYAPKEPKLVPSWSTTTSVDKAGWTQVVIQGGQYVLSDVNTGQSMAMVNASINDVLEAGPRGRFRLFWSGDGTSDGGAFGRRGFEKMNDISISCPNNNEVTI